MKKSKKSSKQKSKKKSSARKFKVTKLSKKPVQPGPKVKIRTKSKGQFIQPVSQMNSGRWNMFVFVFCATFLIVSVLSFNFPEVRDALHRSFNGMFVVQSNVVHQAGPEKELFADVPADHPNYAAITYLFREGITKGYADGLFKPDNNLNRAELVHLLLASLKVEPHKLSNSFCFKDVKDQWFATAVCYGKTKGWVTGFEDGKFNPEKDVSKAEATKIIITAFGFGLVEKPTEIVFFDVKDQWFAKYVWTALKEGIVQDTPPAIFGPNNSINRGQVAEMIYRAQLKNF